MSHTVLSLVPGPSPTPDLATAVRGALAAMTWLGPSDQALSALALRLAEEIDGADPADAAKAMGLLGPQLQRVLQDLGGTPGTRKALQPDQPVGGRLAQLRAAAAG